MVEIDTGNKWVDLAIRGASTLLGFAAAALVGCAFGPAVSRHTGVSRLVLKAGEFGIGTVVTYEVAGKMNDEIREFVDGYNTFAHELNEGRKAINESSERGGILYDEGAC